MELAPIKLNDIDESKALAAQKAYLVPIDVFCTKGVSSGGATGSTSIEGPGSVFYQLKKSIANSSIFRWFRSWGTDREILAEFTASAVSSAINPAMAPHVALVTSKSGQINIASQHLENSKPIGTKKTPVVLKEDKAQLAQAIALSALNGDHDVNPENLHSTESNIARIDFGHAFNNLVRNGKPVSENRIIDFFNREEMDHVPWKSGKPKLWRHYEDGLIPSQEMADALTVLSKPENMAKITTGLNTAKSALLKISDQKTQEHIRKSLEKIAETLSTRRIAKKDVSYKDYLDVFFELTLLPFYKKNIKDMEKAAVQIQLQANIDNHLLKNSALPAAPQGTIEWIKTNAKQKAFKGSFEDYVEQRRQYLLSGIKP